MIKTFKYKEIELTVKTNMLKNRVCYFGEKDILSSLEHVYREETYGKSDITPELLLITLYKKLATMGIKLNSISTGNLIYTGVAMTDLAKQETLKE